MDVITFFGQLFALAAVILGTIFSLVGVLGYVRLPDVYTRLHAVGKVGVFGVVFLILASISLSIAGLGKGLVLIAYLIVAGPVSTHALASAAYRISIPLKHGSRDDLLSYVRDIRSKGESI
jgi:multicomponent Na+:H+ antiporter subunit G